MHLPGNHRAVARFNMANCEKDNVNEGEENAQFKAMHCTLLRCPGVGLCADPLMCAATLFPNAQGDQGGCASWPPQHEHGSKSIRLRSPRLSSSAPGVKHTYGFEAIVRVPGPGEA